jgi:hypothetical protein
MQSTSKNIGFAPFIQAALLAILLSGIGAMLVAK